MRWQANNVVAASIKPDQTARALKPLPCTTAPCEQKFSCDQVNPNYKDVSSDFATRILLGVDTRLRKTWECTYCGVFTSWWHLLFEGRQCKNILDTHFMSASASSLLCHHLHRNPLAVVSSSWNYWYFGEQLDVKPRNFSRRNQQVVRNQSSSAVALSAFHQGHWHVFHFWLRLARFVWTNRSINTPEMSLSKHEKASCLLLWKYLWKTLRGASVISCAHCRWRSYPASRESFESTIGQIATAPTTFPRASPCDFSLQDGYSHLLINFLPGSWKIPAVLWLVIHSTKCTR